jgi:hypothetical protein
MTRPPRNGDHPPHYDHEPGHDSDRRSPADAGGLPDQLALAELANAGVPDVVDGVPPVPINVWRLTDVGRPDAHHRGSGLPPQLAVLLLGVFTRPGDVVVDVAADVALGGVARAGARQYLSVHDPTDLAGLADVTGEARVVFLLWPLPARSETDATRTPPNPAATVFSPCRRLLAAGGCVIAALAPGATQRPYVEQSQLVIQAARQA